MDKNVEALKEICKGVKIGMDSIEYLQDKAQTSELSNYLKHEYSMYNNVLDKVNDAFSNYGEEPNDNNFATKAMLWYGIQTNTIKDKSDSKISELLMEGTNMGIIEGRRILNAHDDLDTDVKKLINDFVNYQEHSVEKLKKFL